MRPLKSKTLFAAAASQNYRKHLPRSSPICEFSQRSLPAAAGFGIRRLKLGNLFGAAGAAEIYRKHLLRSAPIRDFSHRSRSARYGQTYERKTAARVGQIYERKRLPAELSALWNLTELTCDSAAPGGVCHVYLIGTAHTLPFSCKQVKALIEFVKPEVVFLELCDRPLTFLRLFSISNINDGGEFYVANEEGKKYDAKIILGDLSMDTLHQMLTFMVFTVEFCLLSYTLSYVKLIDIIKKCFQKDYLGAWCLAGEELVRICPFALEFILNERDQYMSAKMLEVARMHKSVVAVVGMGHLPGIRKHWKQPVDMKRLLHTPYRTRMDECAQRILNDPLQYLLPRLKDEATSQRTNGEN